MTERYRNLTPEECARSMRARMFRSYLIYTIALIIILTWRFRMGTTLLDWYYDYYIEIEAYDAINAHYTRIFVIGVAVCFLAVGFVAYLNEAFFIGILNTLCDPEKYVKAELIRCKKSFLRRLSRRNKMNIGVAYHAMEDYENARKYYEVLVPADPYKCRNKVLLCRMVSFFQDIGDDEKASVYKSRLEQLRTPGWRGFLVEFTLDNISIDDAIKAQRYEEAKNLIAKYIKSSRVATYTKTVYHYYLGLIAYETNDIPEAIYRFRTALETGEKLPFAKDARLKLGELGPI